jgi:RNA polymerase sigma-70 factor (ECF subfamily)
VDDAEAVGLARQGDRRGAEWLLARYQMSVYTTTYRLLGNHADAEDATQDVFLKAFQRLEQYRPGEPFGAWLTGIARHHSIDVLRRRRDPMTTAEARPSAIDVEHAVLTRLDRARVQAAVNRLPNRDRTLLVLRYWEDQPVERIAQLLGMTEGAAKVALVRARRSLAGVLTREVATDAV